jgi:hypothetical protein
MSGRVVAQTLQIKAAAAAFFEIKAAAAAFFDPGSCGCLFPFLCTPREPACAA